MDIEAKLSGFLLSRSIKAAPGITVLFGPSGCGKSTTLNCVAGIVRPSSGIISFDDRPFFDSAARVDLSPQQRNLGYVLQNAALFPHLDVRKNVLFGISEWSTEEKSKRLDELTRDLRLQELLDRRPLQLSVGQAQRVALARALARRPKLLLLDEPFSALDAAMREEMGTHVRFVQQEQNLTVILVTHSRDEAEKLADAIIEM